MTPEQQLFYGDVQRLSDTLESAVAGFNPVILPAVELNQAAQKAVRVLIEFNQKRGFSIEPTAPLLVNRKHKRLRTRAVQYMFEKWREKADLDNRVTPHSARHAFATALMEKSVPTALAKDLLGHSRLASTGR